jgi:hypothetical protein
VSIAFLLGFSVVMQYPSKFQKICYRAPRIMRYPTRGIACALNIPKHEQCPFDSLDQNNLARGVY